MPENEPENKAENAADAAGAGERQPWQPPQVSRPLPSFRWAELIRLHPFAPKLQQLWSVAGRLVWRDVPTVLLPPEDFAKTEIEG